jgi:hypothetical protein
MNKACATACRGGTESVSARANVEAHTGDGEAAVAMGVRYLRPVWGRARLTIAAGGPRGSYKHDNT